MAERHVICMCALTPVPLSGRTTAAKLLWPGPSSPGGFHIYRLPFPARRMARFPFNPSARPPDSATEEPAQWTEGGVKNKKEAFLKTDAKIGNLFITDGRKNPFLFKI